MSNTCASIMEIPSMVSKSSSASRRWFWFRQWYQNHLLLAAVAGPPLREVAEKIRHASNFPSGKKPFVVFSCHDVTLLSILYGVGADFLSSDEDLDDLGISSCKEKQRYWPAYASTLAFELVRAKDGNQFIRILLNGETVSTLATIRKDKNLTSNRDESQPSHILTVDEFCLIVDELEAKV